MELYVKTLFLLDKKFYIPINSNLNQKPHQ